MANPFSKGWKYLQASLDHSIEQNADPQIQIRQAIKGAKKQHQQISQQAAAVIGNKNQLEMKLNRFSKRNNVWLCYIFKDLFFKYVTNDFI